MVHALRQRLENYLSLKSFFRGLAGGALLYVLIFAGVFWQGGKAAHKWQEKSPTQTVVVDGVNIANPEHRLAMERLAAGKRGEDLNSKPLEDISQADLQGIYEETDAGRLPVKRRKDGLTIFDAFRLPFDREAAGDKPRIALGVVGLGLSALATESAIRTMPPEVSLIMSPYAKELDFWVREGRGRGHEIWLSLPMETLDYPKDDPGPHSLIIGAPEQENLRKLHWVMSRAEGYVGFVGQENNIFLDAGNDMRPVMGDIYQRGIGFIDTGIRPSAIAKAMAHGMHAPYMAVDLWVDSPTTKEDIRAALQQLETIAKENGQATGLIHPTPLSYRETLAWLKQARKAGFIIMPLSASMKD